MMEKHLHELWYDKTKNYDLGDIFQNYSYDIILMVEKTSDDINIIKNFNESVTSDLIKPISFDSLTTIVKNYLSKANLESKGEYFGLVRTLCQKFLTDGASQCLIACLLKLQIMSIIESDIIKEKELLWVLHHKHLFFVLSGFHNIHLIEEMWKIKMPFTGVLEVFGITKKKSFIDDPKRMFFDVTKSGHFDVTKRACVDVTKCTYFDVTKYAPPNVTIHKPFDIVLQEFWNGLYQYLEEQPEILYLQDCIHMKADLTVKKNELCSTLYIQKQIFRILDIKRLYSNYIQNLKTYSWTCNPICRRAKSFLVYTGIMNAMPPECFTVAHLLHAMLEQVCHNKRFKKKKIRQSTSLLKKIIDSEVKLYKLNLLTHNKSELLNLKLVKEDVITDSADVVAYKASSYPKLAKKLLQINNNMLKRNRVTLLWKNFGKTNSLNVLRVQLLGELENIMGYSCDKTVDFHIIKNLFNKVPCAAKRLENTTESHLRDICCARVRHSSETQVCKPLEESSKTTKKERVRIIEVDRNKDYLYESVNSHLYKWYEKFPANVMAQQLIEAVQTYLCFDHQYNVLHDTLLLRFHNDHDSFGMKKVRWNQFLRTPVCIRDFCKYIIDKDDDWLQDEFAKKLIAYDVGNTILQLTGTTTTFSSLDGYRITADTTNFVGKPFGVSINLSVKNNSFVFHCPKTADDIRFHYSLHDGTLIVFSKEICKPQIMLGEVSKSKMSKLKKPKKFYYVVETEHEDSNLVTTDIVTEDLKLLVPPDSKCNRSTSLSNFVKMIDPSMFLGESEKPLCSCHEVYELNEVTRVYWKCSHHDIITPDTYSTQNSISVFDEDSLKSDNCISKKNSQSQTDSVNNEIKCLLKLISEAKIFQVPWFKVCSSPLHRQHYIKPVNSYIRFILRSYVVSVLYRHPLYKCRSILKSVRLFPQCTRSREIDEPMYGMRIVLPTGLVIYLVSGTILKQKYISKGPQCKSLKDEHSRTFSKNGHVVIRKTDGSVEVLTPSGAIIKFKVPYKFEKTYTRRELDRKKKYTRVLTKTERKIWRTVPRLSNHFIGTRKQLLRKKRKPKPLLWYNYVDRLGSCVESFGCNFQTLNQVYRREFPDQTYSIARDDGTKSKLQIDGNLTTEYTDKTTITSWPEMLLNEPYIDWVIVYMVVRVEHPNYTTVTYNCLEDTTKLTFGNDLEVDVEPLCYKVNVSKVFSSTITCSDIYIRTAKRNRCKQHNLTSISLKPLYAKLVSIENEVLLRSCDSYGKCFIVKYGGQYQRSGQFSDRCYSVKKEACRNHDQERHQKLFVLKRDLSGIRLVDDKEFYSRTRVSDSTILQDCEDSEYNEGDVPCVGVINMEPSAFSRFYYFPLKLPVHTTTTYFHCIPIDGAITPLIENVLMNIYKNLCTNEDELFLKIIESDVSIPLPEHNMAKETSFFNALLKAKINKIFPKMVGKSFSPLSKQGILLRAILRYLEKDNKEQKACSSNEGPHFARTIFESFDKNFQVYNTGISDRTIEIMEPGTNCRQDLNQQNFHTSADYNPSSFKHNARGVCEPTYAKPPFAKRKDKKRHTKNLKGKIPPKSTKPQKASSKKAPLVDSSKSKINDKNPFTSSSATFSYMIAQIQQSGNILKQFDKRLKNDK